MKFILIPIFLSFFISGSYAQNKEELRKKLDELDNGLLRIQALEKFKDKDYSGAILDFSYLISLFPSEWEHYYFRGKSKGYLGDYSGALTDISKAEGFGVPAEHLAEIFSSKGYYKSVLGDYRGAILEYTKVIEKDPRNSNAFQNRGLSKANLKDYRGAILDYNKAIELSPNDPQNYRSRGICKIRFNQKESGCLDLSKAGELGLSSVYEEIRVMCK
ncbi:tetratricopeptide repeat protein [Algoriphagus boseongensis]|uniref:Tetratricopeptide repeat protein n=1 Tax=Algoriphagus boseongensis TaxID=1442587 RepID=A0A4R6T7G2_9BACT|nr:tetratricopeptide repeat protein [Algoriphagus boseongensis]TDQ18601.1 tetratricopeptide repeat protein [Algoriphagus boseongensis]